MTAIDLDSAKTDNVYPPIAPLMIIHERSLG
jgi:hypothetical protein